jgi:hypothetical protein
MLWLLDGRTVQRQAADGVGIGVNARKERARSVAANGERRHAEQLRAEPCAPAVFPDLRLS